MIHIVDGQNDTILDDITLDNIISDSHKKSFEDTLETYEFITFADRNYSEYLAKMNRIIIPDEDNTLRELVIQITENYRDTEGQKKQVLSYASYLLLAKEKIIYPTTKKDQTASMIAGWALSDTEWSVGIVESNKVRSFTIENHTNPYSFLKTIANEFELELRFRVEHNGHKITGRYVDLLERIGEFRGREVVFGRDLDSIRRVENNEEIVTALLCLGPEKEDGTRLEVLVEDYEALQRWGRADKNGQLKHLIDVYEPESSREEMTEEELRQYGRTELNKRINSVITYECSIVDLERIYGSNEKIYYGDTIRIKDEKFNPPLFLEARVFEIERSIKNKAKKDIKLGDYVEYTEEEINAIWNQLRNEIRRRLDRVAIVSITSTAGNVFKNAQGETELTARTFVNGAERDEDGTLYDYQWMRFDKHGNHDTNFYAEGKTITVTANDIDEKTTYRVLVAYELEVINTAEITISNVFDGEDGEPGPPGEQGPKGEDGQGLENIAIEYYLSDSDSTPIGGTWTETKPTYQPDKYLWIRQKITYKNPTEIEYTTPVLDDSWKAIEIAEGAKDDALKAVTTADGKNTVIFSTTEPSIEGRKIGDVWFDTSRDNLMHRFNGVEWVEAKWGEQSIVANSITANHIKSLVGLNVNDQFIVDSQGNVKFTGHLEGASGTFGDVTVTDGDFSLQDAIIGTKYSATPRRNLIKDHSFEMVKTDLSSLGSDNIEHNWSDIADNEIYQDSAWYKVGSPKVAIQMVPVHRNALPIFGEKAIVVRNANFVRQYIYKGIGANSQYTISAHFKRQWNTSPGIPRIEIWHVDISGNRVSKIVNKTFPRVKTDYSVQLNSVTFTVPSSFGVEEMLEVIISGGDDNWVQCDGVQMNEGTRASVYLPEDTIWDMYNGYFSPKSRVIILWAGAHHPLNTHTIRPSKQLSDCTTGWILQWQRYVPGTGIEHSNYQFTYIPKATLIKNGTGRGHRAVLLSHNTPVTKYFYIYDDRITGHADNGSGENQNIVLSAVYEF